MASRPTTSVESTPSRADRNYSEGLIKALVRIIHKGARMEREFLKPARSVSYRSYRDTNGAFSIITNAASHECLTLEGASSEIWRSIECYSTYSALLKHAATQEISQIELDEFLSSLREAGLITISSDPETELPKRRPPPKPRYQSDSSSPDQRDKVDFAEVEDEIKERALESGYLWAFFWELTYRCNERCVHCFNPGAAHTDGVKPNRNRNELTEEEIVTTLDDLVALGVFKITISGGEVLTSKKLFFLMEESRKRGFQLHIYTNGLLLDAKNASKLASYYPDTVSLSVYSTNPEIHDEFTKVPGSYSRTIAAIKLLHKQNIRVIIKSVLTKKTGHDWKQLESLAKELGVRISFDPMISAANDGAKAPLSHNLDLEQIVEISKSTGSPLYPGDESNGWGAINKPMDREVCGAGVSMLSMSPTGEVSPCVALPLTIGDIRLGQSISDIWAERKLTTEIKFNSNEPSRIKTLGDWRSVKLASYAECGTHERCKWCHKCPGAGLTETGDVLLASRTQCKIAEGRMIAARNLKNGMTSENELIKLKPVE